MYLPEHFREERLEAMHQLIHDYPLGMLVTQSAAGLSANHIPFLMDPEPTPYGTLRGHVARHNPVWQEHRADLDALVVFQGPDAYISPNWYPSKAEHGKVVPTWNYAVVHAYGPLKVVDDSDWLRHFLGNLTDRHESHQPAPWHLDDAPEDYLQATLRAIVGIEIP
ncbi:MAG: FMN-binding negative transcriptional regulator, partial [Betaproteobacteria bacterium]|nr:FMN-binding negative transcriptional regulator [Betaproteobacteria bacterium]